MTFARIFPWLLFAVAIGVNATNLPGAHFVWDDTYVVEDNPAIRDLANAPEFFRQV